MTPINTPTWSLERNPYYWAVDTVGNQLPYIDRIVMSLAENLEVLNLRAIAGEYDLQERHTTLPKLPVFIENQKRGNYSIHLDPVQFGCDAGLLVNTAYEADPEVAKWLTNRDFRHAIALGIDRDQLNEAFWLGLGTPGSAAPADALVYASGLASRRHPQDSGSGWSWLSPFLQGSCIPCNMPVYPGAPPDFLTLSRSLLPDLLYPFSVVAQR